ncbi:MAG: hypothetical protein JWO82_3784 [Akkermansiaceae bacterium]|nr:hypothetical protein [Akkermansiaceae bacterium]
MKPASASPPRRFGLSRADRVGWIITIVLCISLVIGWTVVKRQRQAAERDWSVHSLKSLGLVLQEFAAEHGCYPDESTAPAVKTATGTDLDLSGSTSNRLFRQLIASGLKSERPFFSKFGGSRKPDNLFENDATALAPGECGYWYLTSDGSGQWGPEAVLAMTPLLKGSTRFDPEPLGGMAVILYQSNAARVLPIQRDGQVLSPLTGKSLLDPQDPCWHGHPPVIHECE